MEDQEWKDDHFYHQFFQSGSDSQQSDYGRQWQQNQQNFNYFQSKKEVQQYNKVEQNDKQQKCRSIDKNKSQYNNYSISQEDFSTKYEQDRIINTKKSNNLFLERKRQIKIGSGLRFQASNKKLESYQKISNQIGMKAIVCLHDAFPQKNIESLIQAIRDRLQSAKQKQKSSLITMTMDQLQTYHLKSGVKKFIPPRSNYSYAALKIKQEEKDNQSYVKCEIVKKQNCEQQEQINLQRTLTQQQQFQKVKGIFCLTKLVRQSKSYADLKNIIFKKFNNKDAFQMCKDKEQYLKKLATMKQATIYFFKIGYDVKKMRTLMDNYTLSRIKYQKLFLAIIRLLVRLVETFIIKYYSPNITAIPHSPDLLLLQAPFHNPNQHFEQKTVQIYYKILRLMFEIGDQKQNMLKFNEVFQFYQQIHNTIQRTLRQRQKYRETTNQKLISLLKSKQQKKSG